MMRVLHVIGAMDRGGAETMVMNLYRAIDRSEVQFDFVVHEERDCDYDAEIISLGGRIFHVPRFNGANYRAYRRFFSDLFESHPEWPVVHGHIGSSAAIYLSEAKRAGRVAIAHSHAQNYTRGLDGIVFRIISYPTRYIADWFLGCSVEACVDRFGARIAQGERCCILRNGIDLSRYAFNAETRVRMRDEFGVQGDAPVFCHVGRLTEVKNHAFLLEVFSRIQYEMPNAVLLLAGRGELEDSVRRSVKERGLAESVKFLGVRDDICNVLQAADVFLFPSRKEGLPVAAVEAQASGLPCLISKGVPETALLSGSAVHVDLAEGARYWALLAIDLARNSQTGNRLRGVEEVREAGFSAEKNVEWLNNFYKVAISGEDRVI